MRLQIGKIWLIAIIGIATASEAKAQLVSSNPLEWMALAEGNELINSEIEKQINGQTKTALLLLSSTRYTNGRRSTTAT
jgi:hypothetical protein